MNRRSAHDFYLRQVVNRYSLLTTERDRLMNPVQQLQEIALELASVEGDLDDALPKHQQLEPSPALTRQELIARYSPSASATLPAVANPAAQPRGPNG